MDFCNEMKENGISENLYFWNMYLVHLEVFFQIIMFVLVMCQGTRIPEG